MLYLLPTPLAEGEEAQKFLSLYRDIIPKIGLFLVENKKAARAVLKLCNIQRPLADIEMYQLDQELDYDQLLKAHENIAIMSEAGCPCVADPGNAVVLKAHALGIKVVPLIGPSSILLALMASGLNGQQFRFHGYLPIKEPQRTGTVKQLFKDKETHIFIETPYRAETTAKYLITILPKTALLTFAYNLTGSDQKIQTRTIAEWETNPPKLFKFPTIFLFQNR